MKDNYKEFKEAINKVNNMYYSKLNYIPKQYFNNNFETLKSIPEFRYKYFLNSIQNTSENILNTRMINTINNINSRINDIYNTNTIEYLNIISKINMNTYINTSFFVNDNNQLDNITINKDLKPIESAVAQYTGYACREDSKTTIAEAYEKSIVKDIENEAEEIMALIKLIIIKNKDLFKDSESLIDLAYNIKDIAENKKAFSYIINQLYKSIYEGTMIGNDCQIYAIANESNNKDIFDLLDFIKHIRQYYHHSHKQTNKSIIKEVDAFIKEKTNKEYPIKAKEWVILQLELYKKVKRLLLLVSDSL